MPGPPVICNPETACIYAGTCKWHNRRMQLHQQAGRYTLHGRRVTGTCDGYVSALIPVCHITCNDGNPCTIDSVDMVNCTCVFTPNTGAACNDGNYCTVNDSAPAPASARAPRQQLKSCDDGNTCTVYDKCMSGVCKGSAGFRQNLHDNNADQRVLERVCKGTNKDCRDGSYCTTDTCDPATGACGHTDIVCNDNNVCTIDSCDPAKGCKYTA